MLKQMTRREEQMKHLLKQYFGYDDFRPGQKKLIDSIMAGRDVLGIMPTGAGKSICYQIPALAMQGTTIVVSPLISLMKDQVTALNQAGVHAAYINSSLTESQISMAFANAKKNTYKIIYIAPERLDTQQFFDYSETADVTLVAVDEAHCVSQWGQDFRPGYLNVAAFVTRLEEKGKRPVLCAFTATATKEVKDDMVCMLGLRDPNILVTGFDRENLYFAVERPKDKMEAALRYVTGREGESGIIYCNTRNGVEEVCEMLVAHGVPAAKYHAGMSNQERMENQDDFLYDRKPVIVATNAFGMGIDKSNVRYVLHYNMPQSMENYYQEAGRAGRDGGAAHCVLFYAPKDTATNRFLLENKESKKEITEEERKEILERDLQRLKVMTFYSTTKECLRKYILNYFGETTHMDCHNCGNCDADFEKHDVTQLGRQVVNCVYEVRQRFGINMILGVLRGSKNAKIIRYGFDRLKTYGKLADYAEPTLRQVIDALLQEEILIQTADQYPVLCLGKGYAKLKDEEFLLMIKTEVRKNVTGDGAGGEEEKAGGNGQAKGALGKGALDDAGFALFEKLRQKRLALAKEERVPPYIVFSDKTLIDMCRKHPRTLEEMLGVSGVGASKLEKYGKVFLEVILEAKEGT